MTMRHSRLLVAVIALCCSSCATQKTATKQSTDTYRSDSSTIAHKANDVRVDSVYVRDSVVVMIEGETKYVDRWHIEYRDRYVKKTDTLVQTLVVTDIKRDTIVETKVVEKELTMMQKVAVSAFPFACMVLLILLFGAVIVGKVTRIRRYLSER